MKLELGFKQVDDNSVYVKNDVAGIDLVAAVCTGNMAWNGNFEAKQRPDTELRLKYYGTYGGNRGSYTGVEINSKANECSIEFDQSGARYPG